jgi:hypothetical protein
MDDNHFGYKQKIFLKKTIAWSIGINYINLVTWFAIIYRCNRQCVIIAFMKMN